MVWRQEFFSDFCCWANCNCWLSRAEHNQNPPTANRQQAPQIAIARLFQRARKSPFRPLPPSTAGFSCRSVSANFTIRMFASITPELGPAKHHPVQHGHTHNTKTGRNYSKHTQGHKGEQGTHPSGVPFDCKNATTCRTQPSMMLGSITCRFEPSHARGPGRAAGGAPCRSRGCRRRGAAQ